MFLMEPWLCSSPLSPGSDFGIFLEHVASAEQPGVIRLERHMGGGEGSMGVAAPRVKYTLQALDDANLKWFKEAPECFDVGRGDYVQFNLEHGQVNGVDRLATLFVFNFVVLNSHFCLTTYQSTPQRRLCVSDTKQAA